MTISGPIWILVILLLFASVANLIFYFYQKKQDKQNEPDFEKAIVIRFPANFDIDGDWECDIQTNLTPYELNKFISRLPVADQDEIILLKAQHDYLKDGNVE